MDKIKKIAKYVLLVIIAYMLVNLMSYAFIMKSYKNMDNCEVLINRPSVEILDSKATKVNGYLVGKVTNNTDSLIYAEYLRVNFYNERNNYLGTEYIGVNSLQAGKNLEFKLKYKYSHVSKITIDVTEGHEKPEEAKDLEVYINPAFFKVMTFTAILLGIWYLL